MKETTLVIFGLIALVIVLAIAVLYLVLVRHAPTSAQGVLSADLAEANSTGAGGVGITYNVNVSASSVTLPTASTNATAYYYRLGNDSKLALASPYSNFAVYDINGTLVECEEYTYTFSTSTVTCSAANTSSYYNEINFTALEKLKNLSLSSLQLLGTRNFDGRSCDLFYLPINQSAFAQLGSVFAGVGEAAVSYQSLPTSFSVGLHFCLDTQRGYPDNITMTIGQYSNLTSKTTPIATITAKQTNFTTSVQRSFFSVPVRLSLVNSSCGESGVGFNVTSFFSSTNSTARVLISNYSYVVTPLGASQPVSGSATGKRFVDNATTTVDNGVSFGKTYAVSAKLPNKLTEGQDYNDTLCVAGSCASSICYVPQVSQEFNITGVIANVPVNSSLPMFQTNATHNYLPTSLSVGSGYPFYVCAFGGSSNFASPLLAAQTDVASYDTYIEHQTDSVCNANVSSLYPWYTGDYGSLAGFGVQNATHYTAYLNSSLYYTTSVSLNYTTNSSTSLVLIAASCSNSGCNTVSLPSGCTERQDQLFMGTGAYMATCTGQAPGTYNVTVSFNYGEASAAAYVFSR